MKELFDSPGLLSARSTLGSDISFFVAIIFTSMFIVAGYFALKRRGRAHHRMILVSMATMIFYFGYYYMVRKLGVASMQDQHNFPGPQWVYFKVFRPTLYVHFLIVSLSTSISIYMVGNGFRTAYARENGQLGLRGGPIGRCWKLWGAGGLWLIYLCWWTFSSTLFTNRHIAMILALGYFIPAGAILLLGKALPEAEKRHRTLGRICIALFITLLGTSAFVYYLLYIAF